jgi:hypothetical protein
VTADMTHTDLAWFMRQAATEMEIPFLLGSLSITDDAIPKEAYDPKAITRHRKIRDRLLAIPKPHADVLAWCFEDRQWNPRILSAFSWPSVSVRTFAAQFAFACAGQAEIPVSALVPTRRQPGLRPANAFMRHRGVWSPPDRGERSVRVPTGDYHRGKRPSGWRVERDSDGNPIGEYEITIDGIEAFFVELAQRPKSDVVTAIRAETSRRVNAAFRAYESVEIQKTRAV